MKGFIRTFIINLASLNSAVFFIPGLTNTGGIKTLIFSTIILSLINTFVKPIITLLLLPINLITLGTFKWLVNVLVILILTAIVANLKLNSFTFPGIDYQGFIIPKFVVSNFFVLVLSSACFSITNIFLFWLVKDS